MNDNEKPKIKLPRSHPHLATLRIDPVDWYRLERLAEDRPELSVRHLDRPEPDEWTVYVGCASEAVRELLEENW